MQKYAYLIVGSGLFGATFAYRALAAQEADVVFGGRLAQYRYYDMAPVIEQVLNLEEV